MTEPSNGVPAMGPWKLVLAILGLALCLRVACVYQTPLVGADSARFLAAAEHFEHDRHLDGVADAYHPLTAYLIAQIHSVQRVFLPADLDPFQERVWRERAGVALSVITGLLAVWLLMDLTRWLFPSISACWVGLLAACQPHLVRSAGDVMSDSLFLALFLFALREAVRWAREPRGWAALTAGGTVGAAYLARPEALVLLGVIPLFWFLRERSRLGQWFSGKWISGSLIFTLMAAALILPYAQSISWLAGEYVITLKKSLGVVGFCGGWGAFSSGILASGFGASGFGGAPGLEEVMGSGEVLRAGLLDGVDLKILLEVLRRWWTTAPEWVAAPALVGIVVLYRRSRKEAEEAEEDGGTLGRWGPLLFGLAAGAMICVLLRLVAVAGPGYLSRRHTFTLVLLCLPFAAAGYLAMGAQLHRWSRQRVPRQLGAVLLAIVAVAPAAKVLRGDRWDQLAQKQAGILIYDRFGAGESILSNREKIAYYACGSLTLIHYDPADVTQRAKRQERAWIAYYREDFQEVCPEYDAQSWCESHPGLRLEKVIVDTHREPPRHLELLLWERPD